LWILIILVWCVSPVQGKPSSQGGVITGQVSDSLDNEPLSGASVALVDHYSGTIADDNGRFILRKLTPGIYRLQISQVGYETAIVDSLVLLSGDTLRITCRLNRKPIKLSNITVAPGTYGIMEQTPTTSTGMTRDHIETIPHFGEDLYRAIKRLPGISSGEYSTRFKVRGGNYDEVLVTLDGLRLYEPFHLKDVDGGALSIIDIGAVDDVEIMTGGFGANYGDAMSGVLTIDSRRPRHDDPRYTAGLSLFNARLLADGFYADGRGEWLVAARRGYFDLALQLAGEDDDISPVYYDLFAKTRYQISGNHILSVHALHAGDRLEYFYTDNDADSLFADWNNSYLWATLHSQLGKRISVFNLVGAGYFDHERHGQGYNESYGYALYRIRDAEDCHMAAARSDWQWDLSDKILLSWGGEYHYLGADFDYLEERLYNRGAFIDTTHVFLERSGRRYAAYLTGRRRFKEALTLELGGRYDHATHTGGEHLSPRANVSYELSSNTSLRLGWGYFYQSQEVSDLEVPDGDTLYSPDERAEHFVAGCQWEPRPGYMLRFEAYYKRYHNPRSEFRNLYENLHMFPEAEWDRVYVTRSAARARGVELFFSRDNGGKLAWWLSYAYARAEDDIEQVNYNGSIQDYGQTVPSLQDQEHTLHLDLAYRPTGRWQINLAFAYHTGWPYSSRSLIVQTDQYGRPYAYRTQPQYWDSRVDYYQRIDIRVNRHFNLSRGRLTAFAELINVFDRDNLRCYYTDMECANHECYLVMKPQYWFGRLPSFGITYSWDF